MLCTFSSTPFSQLWLLAVGVVLPDPEPVRASSFVSCPVIRPFTQAIASRPKVLALKEAVVPTTPMSLPLRADVPAKATSLALRKAVVSSPTSLPLEKAVASSAVSVEHGTLLPLLMLQRGLFSSATAAVLQGGVSCAPPAWKLPEFPPSGCVRCPPPDCLEVGSLASNDASGRSVTRN